METIPSTESGFHKEPNIEVMHYFHFHNKKQKVINVPIVGAMALLKTLLAHGINNIEFVEMVWL